MSAAGCRLNNLCLIIDRNHMQVDGHTDQVMPMEPLAAKWEAFGWRVPQIDGNKMQQIVEALAVARDHTAGPTCIIATTVPGKGVPCDTDRQTPLLDLEIGKGQVLAEGADVAILASGMTVPEAIAAKNLLAQNDVSATVVKVPLGASR